MENCPDTEMLLQWLNGTLTEALTLRIRKHVGSCDNCQNCLGDLTDENSLQPPKDPEGLLGGRTFTNEPHFKSLRQKLKERVSDLKSDPGPDNDIGGIRNSISSAVEVIDTVATNMDQTDINGDHTGLREQGAIEIQGYRIERLIGRGGFAQVFQGWEQRLKRSVAIKVLDQNRIDARNRHRFLREAKVVGSVESPNVVRVLTSGETDSGRPFIVMELVKGQTLSQWIDERAERLDRSTIVEGIKHLISICAGVQAVHDAGLIHRDIKPSNIFVDPKLQTAKLGDFGLTRILNEDTITLTRASELAGTPAYMSPEQTSANSELNASSDVYALGATLYHVLTGQPPFRGSSLAILKQVNDAVPLPPRQLNESASTDLETICLKALEKEPNRRYLSAKHLEDDLQRVVDGRPIEARPVSAIGRVIRWAKTNRSLAMSLAFLFLALLAGTTISTSLWLRSEFHATRSSERQSMLVESNNQLKIHAERARVNRKQLAQSVQHMISGSLKRKSSYIKMSGNDRTNAVRIVCTTYSSIFESLGENESDLVREMAIDLAAIADVNFKFSATARVKELLTANDPLIAFLIESPDPTPEDLATAAKFYNQLGELYLIGKSNRKSFSTGKALWDNTLGKDVDSKTASSKCFQKALELSANAEDAFSDLALQHWTAKLHLNSLENVSDSTITDLKTMLEQVIGLRISNTDFSPSWLALQENILKRLAKVSQTELSLEYRKLRGELLESYISHLTNTGQETHWYERSVAVNNFFLGHKNLSAGKVLEARTIIENAVTQLDDLVARFPNNSQFGADLAEACLVLAEIDWNSPEPDAAMTSYQRALDAFESILQFDSGEISIRRRLGVVNQHVGNRYTDLQDYPAAATCFSNGARHLKVVADSPYDPATKKADLAMHRKLLDLAKTVGEKAD